MLLQPAAGIDRFLFGRVLLCCGSHSVSLSFDKANKQVIDFVKRIWPGGFIPSVFIGELIMLFAKG